MGIRWSKSREKADENCDFRYVGPEMHPRHSAQAAKRSGMEAEKGGARTCVCNVHILIHTMPRKCMRSPNR